MKGKLALASVAAVLALVAGGLLVLRTAWAGRELCALAAARLRQATQLELAASACRVEPFRLEVSARDVRIGPAAAPVFTADAVRARLAPIQAPSERLELAELEVTRPRLVARIPGGGGGARLACPPRELERFGVRRLRIEDGALDLTFAGGDRLTVGRLDVRAVPVGRRGVAALAGVAQRRAGLELTVARARLDRAGGAVQVDEGRLDADLALDLSRADVHLAALELPGVSALAAGTVENLCRPRLDLAVSAQGEVPALLALAGVAGASGSGRVVVDASVKGPAGAPEGTGEVRLERVTLGEWRPGDAAAQVRLAGGEVRVERLEVPTAAGRVEAHGVVHLGKQVRLEAEASLHGVELGEVFERLTLPGAWVTARIDGHTRVSGTVVPLQLTGEAALDLASFRVTDHAWDRHRRGEATVLDLPRARVEAGVRVDPTGVRIEPARIRAGQGAMTAHAMLHFDERRGFEVTCEGSADLDQLRHVGPVPLRGLAEVEQAVIRAAPYGNPHVTARVSARDFQLLQLDLGRVETAAVSYDDFVLRVAGGQGRRGVTRYQAEVAVDLEKTPTEVRELRYPAQGRLRDLFEAAMPWLPEARHARDALDAEVVVRGTAHGPAAALEAKFEGDLGRGELAGRAFDGGRLAGRVESGARAVFDVAEVRRGGGTVRGSGWVGFQAPFPWDLRVAFERVPLAALAFPGGPWEGAVTGSTTVRGSYQHPQVELAVRGQDVAVAKVPIGAADVEARLDGTRLAVTGRTSGARVEVTAVTTGEMPFQASAELDVQDVMRFVPGGPPAGLRARVRGRATAQGVLADLAASRAEVRLGEVRGGYGEFQVDNAAPVWVTVQDRRVAVRSLELRGPNTQFAVAGAREPSGALALDARGALDLRLLGGLLPGVADPRGQLLLEAHVGGTTSEPLLVGAGTLREAGFRMRELPVVFTGLSGEVAFSQNRMLFDRLTAAVNGGRAELDGEVELVRFFPARVRVGAQVEEVPLRVPQWLPSVVTGRLQAAGSWDAMLLSGKLHVARALYSDPVDLEKRLVEVRRQRVEPRPIDRAGEWLSLDIALAVDGDARIENDVARAGLRGDLTLTGTLASVGLVGTLTMTPGSRGTFRGNEFVLSHAVVDFTDRRKVRMSLDVHGEAQVREYQVFMHLLGPYESPTLQLTTQPALSQQDIVTLLSLGYTTRDAAAAGAVAGVATAAAAQALFTASGLDDQVRRFVPRGRVLRDFTVRITSAYSEGVGQVVPRAEFESKVLDDRLRLRYQAPLTSARGQSAQAELRLGTHTSLQYQWDTDNPDVASGGDHGIDLKLRWEWTD